MTASACPRSSHASAKAPGAREAPGAEGEAPPLELALDSLGAFGLYQRCAVVLWCLPGVLAAMYSLNYVFVADAVPFRCLVPECESEGLSELAPALLPAGDSCARYRPLNATAAACRREDYHPTDTLACTAFVYDNMDTTFAEFDLGCREWLRTLVGSLRNSALPVALLLTGYLSDSFGRRPAFCLFAACAGALGLVKAFSYNYYMYVVMEWLEAALGYGFNSAAYVMVVELARPSLRTAFAAATGVAYGLGGVLLALLSRRLPYWRHLLLAMHAPALLLPLYWLLADESARWLHARGRRASAAAVIRKAARWNKVTLDENLMSEVDKEQSSEEKQSEGNPWMALLRSRVLLARFGVCCWCWAATSFVYYGLTINSVSLAGDRHVNFALNMAMEVVASLFLVMVLERCGRKWSIFGAFLICGVVCVTPFFVSHAATGLGLYMVGKLTITFAFNALYVFTAELFPTPTRSSAIAACSLVGRIGSILAPQTPLLSQYVQALLYGGGSLAAALALLATPETRRARLPPAVRAAERLRAPAHLTPPPPPPPPAPRVLSADICLVPECESEGLSELAPALLPAGDSCARYRPLNATAAACRREDYHPTDTLACTAFVYDNMDTTFAEFDLGCREWLRTLVGSLRNSALPVALLLTGYLSDSFGRRPAFCLFAACAGALGLVKAFSYNYYMYVVMEWLEAALGYGFNSAAYVMVVELARPSLRTAFAAATGVAYGLGGVLLALLSRRLPYWRHLLLAMHAPALLLPLYWLLADESARWLHARGRRASAAAVIRKAARWNKVTLDENLMSEVDKEQSSEEKQSEGNPWMALLRSRVLLARFGVCCWCWAATSFVYYGLTINSVSLAGDRHVNFALNMAMEVVASLFLVMVLERCGRKWSIFGAFLICGVVCVTPFFVSHAATGLGLYMVGKLTITFAFNALYVFTAELFPTPTRSSAIAACSLVGRIGSILAPQTPLLSQYVQALLYGGGSLAAALALLATPETRRARLPPAVRAAERLRAPAHLTPPPPPPPPAPRVLSADM